MSLPKYGIFLILIFLAGTLFSTSAFADFAKKASKIKIIVNKSVKEDSLSREKIKHIFLGKEIVWNDDSEITVVTLNSMNTHTIFIAAFLRKSTAQFENHWKNMLFTGKGFLPRLFKDETQLIEFVSTKEGSIGYTSLETLPDTVKIIRITD